MRIKKQAIYETLSLIQDYLHSEKYAAINESNKIGQYHIEQRLYLANNCLDEYDLDSIPVESPYSPLGLKNQWVQFDAKYHGTVTPELKSEYGVLVKETLEFLEFVKSLPKIKVTVRHKTSQTVDLGDEKTKMRKIQASRQTLMAEIERQRKKEPQNGDLIKRVQGKNPERWLAYVLKHIKTTPKDKLYTLLPEFWEDDEN